MHSSDPDIWAAGRETQRAEVQAALAPRERRCPHCGEVQTTAARLCRACGQEMVLRRGKVRRRRAALIAGIVVACVAAVSAAIVPGMLDDANEFERTTAERQARLEAAERARLRVDIRPRRADAPARRDGEPALAYRRRLLAAGEAAVTADARRRVAEGTVEGPIEDTRCSPYPKGAIRTAQEADPSLPGGRYHCIAYEQRVEASELQGQERTVIYGTPYFLVLDYDGAPMTFCKIAPRPGEGGVPLATVALPAACTDPLD